MLVMLICCVSAVSAADINGTDDVSDDVVGEVIDDVSNDDVVGEVIDDVSNDSEIDDVVEEVNVDDSQDKGVDKENSRPTPNYYEVNSSNIGSYFDTSTGQVLSTKFLNFQGTFNNVPFSNFIIDKSIGLKFTNAVFYNVGFELAAKGLTINNATFIMNAPNGDDCIAIYVETANNTVISNNVISYTCNYANTANYNHVITIVDSDNVEVSGNNITAYLPLKDVDYSQPYPSIYTDLVAGVAVQSSYKFRFTNNRLLVNVSRNSTGYPTLDAFIIVGSEEAYIAHNTIIEIDNKTMPGNNNYLYAVDVYQCPNSVIDMNKITLESKGGSFIAGTNNGTGAAYGIQLTGGHTGVVISNNNITTSNNGPNCGIYSQNYPGTTGLSITGNRINVTGNAGLHAWSLVTGMELGDDNDYVARNIINVINKAAYVSTHNAYGISYSQAAMGSPTFNITNNTVEVKNGTYAVFIRSGGSGSVTNNCLNTTAYCCNNAVNNNPNVVVSGNYCPLGSNCHCGCNCTSNKNIPTKSILKSGNILGVSSPEVLSAVNEELLTKTECIIYVGENNNGNGNGTKENPFATLLLAYENVTGQHYDRIIINIFNGTYQFGKLLLFDTDELIVQGISGEVIINTKLKYTGISAKAQEAFQLSSSNSTFYANNITFDGATTTVGVKAYWVPFLGVADTVTFTNCKFTNMVDLAVSQELNSFNSYYINCVFENWRQTQLYYKDSFDGVHFASFKNSIFSLNIDGLTRSANGDIRLDGIWFNQNSIPNYIASTPDTVELTKYALFSASETYIGNNLYEIVGKLTWNGTDDVADCFNPMTVTLSSSTGDIQASAVLVNGTFKAIYNSTSSSNLVNVKLDSVEIPLNFSSVDFVVTAPSISCGDTQDITVTFPQIVSGNITVLVDETPYVGTINNNSIVIPVTGVLSVGTHNVNVTFVDEVNHIYGFNTTSFTVSKVSNYDFDATVNPTSVYIGGSSAVALILPSDATGNVTVKVGENEAKTFNINDVISISSFVAGDNVVNITYNGNEKYNAKSIVKNVFASVKQTTVNASDVSTTYNVAKDLVITLKDVEGNVLANKTVNVVVGTINKNLTTDANGQASVDISTLTPNTYTATITFTGDDSCAGSNSSANVVVNKIASKIAAPAVSTTYNVAKNLVITLKDNKGNVLANQKVTVKVGTISKTLTTNAKGQVSVDVSKLTAKKYTATITYKGDTIYAGTSGNAKVSVNKATPKLTAKKATFKAKTKTKKYTVTLKDNKGKALAKAKVTLKVKGVTYKAATNSKGQATFKITKLNKNGNYNAVIKFAGNSNYKAINQKAKITVKK